VKLAPDWKRILVKAWSVRLMALAFVFTALEIALPFLDGYLPIPQRVFAAAAGLAGAGAFVARLVAQKNMEAGS
jgi:hypothetical protein